MSDPLSPASLAAVPEVQKWFWELARQHQNPRGSAEAEIEAENALLLAVRDATLQAERDRLLALTPLDVLADATQAVVAKIDKREFSEIDQEYYADAVRAALPVLLAPEVARREQVEKRLADTERWVADAQARLLTGDNSANYAALQSRRKEVEDACADWHSRATAAESEVARLREALEDLVAAVHNNGPMGSFATEALVKARAALGGAK